MKKHLLGNLILSGIVFALLFILSIILEYNFSAYYYLKIIKGMYFDESADDKTIEFTISAQSKVILVILMIVISFFILYPSIITNFVSSISL